MAEWIEERDPASVARRNPVDNVRLLRDVLFWAGWAVVAVGLVLLVTPFVTNSTAALQGEPLVLYLLGRLYGVLLPPLLVFSAWGALTVLCEIHDRLEDQNDILEGKDNMEDLDEEERWRP